MRNAIVIEGKKIILYYILVIVRIFCKLFYNKIFLNFDINKYTDTEEGNETVAETSARIVPA